jgi:hypothetical protein
MSEEELVSNLKDLLADFKSGEAPFIKKVEKQTSSVGTVRG